MSSGPSDGTANHIWSRIKRHTHHSLKVQRNLSSHYPSYHFTISLLQPWAIASNRPSLIGRYACVGKNLALEEMRFVIALLVSKYYISLAPGEDGVAVLRDTTDEFTAAPGNLYLSFKAVEKPE